MIPLHYYMELDSLFEESLLLAADNRISDVQVSKSHERVSWDEENVGLWFIVLPGIRAQRLDGSHRELANLGSTLSHAFRAYNDLNGASGELTLFRLAVGRDRHTGEIILGMHDPVGYSEDLK